MSWKIARVGDRCDTGQQSVAGLWPRVVRFGTCVFWIDLLLTTSGSAGPHVEFEWTDRFTPSAIKRKPHQVRNGNDHTGMYSSPTRRIAIIILLSQNKRHDFARGEAKGGLRRNFDFSRIGRHCGQGILPMLAVRKTVAIVHKIWKDVCFLVVLCSDYDFSP